MCVCLGVCSNVLVFEFTNHGEAWRIDRDSVRKGRCVIFYKEKGLEKCNNVGVF